MKTLPIIIPGKGRIPRLGCLGPKLDPIRLPFEAIEAIVRAPYTPGATYVADNGEKITMHTGNYREIWNKFATDNNIPAAVKHPTEVVIEREAKKMPVVDTRVPVDPPAKVTETASTEIVPDDKPSADEAPVDDEKPAEVEPSVDETEPTEEVNPNGFKRITKPDDNRRGNNSHKKH